MNGVFQSRDGTSIYYEVRGQGRPLLLCYGLLCRREHWRHQIPALESKYRVVLFDYRGHQKSAVPSNEHHLTLEWCARDIQDLMRLLQLEEVACLGHSVGVPILTHLAEMEPERVKANVFICGAVNNPFEQMLFTDRLDPLFEASAKLNRMVPSASEFIWRKLTAAGTFSHYLASQFGFNPSYASREDIEGYVQGVRETAPRVFYRLMEDYRALDRRELLRKVEAPTLVIAGEDDCITPLEVQKDLARRLPKGELETVAGGSHNAHMEFADWVNARILRFLSDVGY
ncbi:alpha/beta hydrolase [bacterium]|nr:alpha/beta hydrolase [bacterium]